MSGASDFVDPLAEYLLDWVRAQAWQVFEQELLELSRLAEAN